MNVTPSRVARTVAGREWPDVQSQHKLAPGVFGFSCAGHGGIVAVIGIADLPERAVELAREHGKTELIVFRPGEAMYCAGSPASMSTPIYKRDSLAAWAEQHPNYPAFEVWVGEEDCDWSLIVLANDEIRTGGIAGRYFSETTTEEHVRDSARSWNPDFFTALTGEPATAENSYVVRQREFAETNRENYVTRAAWGDWHPPVPKGMVGVVARREAGGDERYFLVPQEEYDKRNGSFVIDTSRHQEVEAW
jgi:hypothetical protein